MRSFEVGEEVVASDVMVVIANIQSLDGLAKFHGFATGRTTLEMG
jgi:hypothetical protein